MTRFRNTFPGELSPLSFTRTNFARRFGIGRTRVMRALYLGSSGEYSFYLTLTGVRTHRSLVGRANSRRAFGLFI